MKRPLMQHGVGQLEELFAKSKVDAKALKQLENELQYRQAPRAVALLAEVRAAMHCANGFGAPAPATTPAPKASPPNQPDLWTSLPPSVPQMPPIRPIAAPTAHTPVTVRAAEPAPTALTPFVREVPTMTVDDACKILKTTSGATWESIEQTRRLLVQQSSPLRTSTMSAEKRAQVLAEARRVNDASWTLSRNRETGR